MTASAPACAAVWRADRRAKTLGRSGRRAVAGRRGLGDTLVRYAAAPKVYCQYTSGDIIPQQFGAFGMVTDAAWSDTDRDGDPDLVIAGEWMPIIILENSQGKLVNKKIISNSFGW